jgi:hypothetical protein
MILLRTLFAMVSATASLLPLMPLGRLSIALGDAPPSQSAPAAGMSSKREIGRGSSASM